MQSVRSACVNVSGLDSTASKRYNGEWRAILVCGTGNRCGENPSAIR